MIAKLISRDSRGSKVWRTFIRDSEASRISPIEVLDRLGRFLMLRGLYGRAAMIQDARNSLAACKELRELGRSADLDLHQEAAAAFLLELFA